MSRRLVATVVAILCTILGAVLITGYVRSADERAMGEFESTNVLVVTQRVAAGTAAEDLGPSVAVTALPRTAVVAGSVVNTAKLAGKVAAVDLQPGEQVLTSRFVDRLDPADTATQAVPVPAGMQTLSVVLTAERVRGGILRPGDKVGVLVTTDQGTKQVLNQALVVNVQGGVAAPTTTPGGASDQGSPSPTPTPSVVQAPQVNVLVTFALSVADSETLVFGKEQGSLWLSVQNDKTVTTGSRVVDAENLFK